MVILLKAFVLPSLAIHCSETLTQTTKLKNEFEFHADQNQFHSMYNSEIFRYLLFIKQTSQAAQKD